MNRLTSPRDLVLSLTLEARRDLVWRCWTKPDLLTQWFTPRPWTTPHAELDVRPGGTCLVVMRSPEGEEIANPGVYLEVVANRKLVFTDAFRSAWEPSDKPFMTAIISFADDGPGRTAYEARARHWSAEDCTRHAEMGFHEGWTQCARQLEALAQTLDGS